MKHVSAHWLRNVISSCICTQYYETGLYVYRDGAVQRMVFEAGEPQFKKIWEPDSVCKLFYEEAHSFVYEEKLFLIPDVVF